MRSSAALVLAGWLSLCRLAHADVPPANTAAEGRRTELYREGVTLGEQGDWAGAARKFREVVQIRSAPKALLALAVAEAKQGHLLEAKRINETALVDAQSAGATHAEEVRA